MLNYTRCFALKLFVLIAISSQAFASSSNRCTYHTYEWDTIAKKSVNHRFIDKLYADITDDEKDRYTGCSVCEEDQSIINIPPVKPFKVCNRLAPRITTVLKRLIQYKKSIMTITAYRVGRTRGDIDIKGLRTQFSNHSYGIALDINAYENGLYDNCIEYSNKCRLIRGGRWQPNNGSLTINSDVVLELKSIGLRWRGEILGKQKDFMHFSPSGY